MSRAMNRSIRALAEGVSYGVEPGGGPYLKNGVGPGRSPAPGFEENGPLS